MRTMKTSELTGRALDYAVALANGEEFQPAWVCDGIGYWHSPHTYSTNWDQAGPIIEREKLSLVPQPSGLWRAQYWQACTHHQAHGTTPLEAAMRCYVASKLGDAVELPEGIL